MEAVQNMKHCPWVSEPIKIWEYFQEYSELIKAETDVIHEMTEAYEASMADDGEGCTGLEEQPGEGIVYVADSKDHLEKDCSISLLTVDDELPVQEMDTEFERRSGRMTNWYTGSYMDGVIPDGGEKLATLKAQADELSKRDNVKDYLGLRYRQLKYHSTIRMVHSEKNLPDHLCKKEVSPDEVMINIRIQRPYHKKTHCKKAYNRYPVHSQELLFLGSQKLIELCDAILCVNDYAINQDLSLHPSLEEASKYPKGKDEFRSAMLYIGNNFYIDRRMAGAKDYSENVKKWASRIPEFAPMETRDMESTRFIDLVVRLGYPYLYMHLGNCEHLVTFTDFRLYHPSDIRDMTRYPVHRGQAPKLSVKCILCNMQLANWLMKGDERFPIPNAHLCDKCLKFFCYDSMMTKLGAFQLYAFNDEVSVESKRKGLKGQDRANWGKSGTRL